MKPQISLGKDQIRDLDSISGIPPDSLRKSREAVLGEIPTPLQSTELRRIVFDHVSDERHAETLVSVLLSLARIVQEWGVGHSELVSAIGDDIRTRSGWGKEKLEAWDAVAEEVVAWLALDAIRLTSKAVGLSFEYANLYRKGRIISDIRPLFDEAVETIEGAVVTFTLRLRFDNTHGEEALSLAMDRSDVEKLREECDRALTKATTAKQFISDAGKSVLVSGE